MIYTNTMNNQTKVWLFYNYILLFFYYVKVILLPLLVKLLLLNFWYFENCLYIIRRNSRLYVYNGPIKSQLINPFTEKNNDSTDMLNVFNIKLKKHDTPITKLENKENTVRKSKHSPPANKEWFNSIYCYNKNATKLLPSTDNIILNLVRSYFNIYSRRLERKTRTRRLRNRVRRLSINRILVSKPEVKHTNDKVVVTIYVYNRQKKYYLNKIKRIASIDQADNLVRAKLRKRLVKYNKPLLIPSNLKINFLKSKSLDVRSKIRKHENVVLHTLNIKNKLDSSSMRPAWTVNKFKNYQVKFLKNYVKKCLRREIFSTYYKQLLFFNKSKFDERYLLPLTRLAKKVYNKKVEFNLVDLKYLNLNSYIFSNTLLTKLKNRKNRLFRVLRTSLLMFKVPPMDKEAVYDEMYNKKWEIQNLNVKYLQREFIDLRAKDETLDQYQYIDIDAIELLLSRVDSRDFLLKLKNYKTYIPKNLRYFHDPLYLTNTILNKIKHKYVSGIRLEVAGRLTRRNTAARSVSKLRYVGNIKNMDSSFKLLPAVFLRGYAKSNLQYTCVKSRRRIGSFGVKGWVSSD